MTRLHPNTRQIAWVPVAGPTGALCCVDLSCRLHEPADGGVESVHGAGSRAAAGDADDRAGHGRSVLSWRPGSGAQMLRRRRRSCRQPTASGLRPRRSPWQLQPLGPLQRPFATATAPKPLEFSDDRTVAIPADNQDLRFALPPPPSDSTPVNQCAAADSAATGRAVGRRHRRRLPPSFPRRSINRLPASSRSCRLPTADASSSGPWRSPQVPQSSVARDAGPVRPAATRPADDVGSATTAAASDRRTANARRAAPGAFAHKLQLLHRQPPAAAEPPVVPPPRMRFPSMLDPSTWFTPSRPANAGGQSATDRLHGARPRRPDAHGLGRAVSGVARRRRRRRPASVANSDGFRPRGTVTK